MALYTARAGLNLRQQGFKAARAFSSTLPAHAVKPEDTEPTDPAVDPKQGGEGFLGVSGYYTLIGLIPP